MFFGPGFGSGFLVGFGAGFVTREIVSIGVGAAKPVTKAVVKSGIATFEKTKENIANLGENFEDLVAEVKSSLTRAPQPATGSAETSKPSKKTSEKKPKKESK